MFFNLLAAKTTQCFHHIARKYLSDESRGSLGLVLPGWWKDSFALVPSSKTMNSGFSLNKSEFGVGVLSVSLQVLSDGNSLLDQMVEIFRDLWGQTVHLQDAEDLV